MDVFKHTRHDFSSKRERNAVRIMELTRNQFDILTSLATGQENATVLSSETTAGLMRELTELGYVQEGKIAKKGLDALEPYRAKRAIFIAAGLGSRLAPITINTPKPLVRVHGTRIIDRLIDACLEAGIQEIYVVRGYLSESFDQLLKKYPMIRFLENTLYREANNVSSALLARRLLGNAYVFEADLLLSNPKIIRKYHYRSNFLAIKKDVTEDWCFEVKDGVIVEEKVGGRNCWQMVGISYWNEKDGAMLAEDVKEVFEMPGGKDRYWEQVPLVDRKERYSVEVRECFDEDVVEIDTFRELQAIDHAYDVSI